MLSKVKDWLSTNLVIPSTLYLHSCTVITGLEHEMVSISPTHISFYILTYLLRVHEQRLVSS